DHQGPSNAWVTIGLTEGKNREVRRLMEYIQLTVNRLIRISFGPFQLGKLDVGAVEEVKQRSLKDQLGLEKSKAQAEGTAKAKPKPKPHAKPKGQMFSSKRQQGWDAKREAREEASKSRVNKPGANKPGAKNADRRRKPAGR
ncbi:MAG: hypothetical protein P8N43_14980, partial [Alphaproteobacteria bacterium]|nr:hypothetical protein [Alphaproteobacteria bacterium]